MYKVHKRGCHLFLIFAFGLIVFGLSLLAPVQAAQPQLPTLNWQQRSDWINVKTGVTPAAYGDGVHDDTAAVQAALNMLADTPSGLRVVYFPAGTYKITNTLTLTQIYGAALIGTGQTTRIVWGGTAGGVMYHSNGASRARYVGILWDGAGKAAVGIDHQSNTYYETCVRHQDEAFINFTLAGIRIGHDQNIPTAEVMYRNCLFQNDADGVAILSWNDYNNDFAQCDFRDCGTGINCVEGNLAARECHFERSAVTDFYLCTFSQSIRRCTSIGSNQFISTAIASTGAAITIEDCHVDSWTNTLGAITLSMRGPNTIFDCSFTHPPCIVPPVSLTNYSSYLQIATVSNNIAPSSMGIINPGVNSQIIQVPAGKRGANLSDPTQTFIHAAESVPSLILDVKTGFGAKGDGSTDDTAALQSALAAARSNGNGAMVYLPPGIYNVSSTLPMSGSGYTVGGTGCASVIQWVGPGLGPVFAVQDPQNVTLEHLRILGPDSVCKVQQTSTGGLSSMTYDGVLVPGSWVGSTPGGVISPTAVTRGLECNGLSSSSVVNLAEFEGAMNFYDCSCATILGGFTVDGVLRVSGGDYAKTGFLGMLSRVSSGNPYDLVVGNNQDLVMTNSYTEQTNRVLNATGDGSYVGIPGHITIQGTQVYTNDPTPITINNYEGRVTYLGAQFGYYQPLGNYNFSQVGTRPANLILFDDNFYQAFTPTSNVAPSTDTGGSLTILGNILASSSTSAYNQSLVNDQLPGVGVFAASAIAPGVTLTAPEATAMGAVSAALDDFRLLGAIDLNINYQLSPSVPAPTVANALSNGSFESPSVGSASYQYNPSGGAWTFAGSSGVQSNGSAWVAANATDGTQTAFLQGHTGPGALGSISQSVNFTGSGNYALTFQAARRMGQVQPIQVSVDGVPVGSTITPVGNTFQAYSSVSFFINATGWHTITLAATDTSSDNSSFVDSVSVIPIVMSALSNGSFESPSVGSASYQYNPSGGAWTFAGSSGVQSNGSAWVAANATDGTQTAFLQGHTGPGALGSISQSVNFTGSGNYALTFQAARRMGQVQPLKFTLDGVQVGGLLTPASSGFGWITTATFAVNTSGPHIIMLSATDGSADLTTLVDQATIIPVSGAVAPTAATQSVTTTLNAPLGITLTGLDSHIPALPLTYTVTSNPAHGTLSGTAPNLTYTPAVSFLGSDSFAFKVNNGTLDSASVSVNLSVTGPTFANSSFESPSVGFASFQYNPTGGVWSFTGNSGILSNGSLFAVANAADGTQTAFLQGKPGASALGSISQNVNFTTTGTYTLAFQAARRQGQAQPIKISVDGVPVSGLLTPASNNFGPLTSAIFPISTPGQHTISLSATDGSADLTTLVDQVTIIPVSMTIAPTAAAQSAATTLNAPLGITLTGTDSNVPALPLTYTVTSNPAHGTLSGTAPNLTYTPAVSFLGSDSFAFKVNNGTLDSASVSVNLSVTGPTFANSSFESPSVGFASFQYNPTGGVWSFTGNSGILSNGSLFAVANAADGTQTAFLQGKPGASALGSISQNVNFTTTGTYTLAFQAARRQGQAQPIKISVDGVPVSGLLTPASNNFGPLTSAIFPISTPGQHTISLSATDGSADLTTLVDQATIIPVSGAVAPTAATQSVTTTLNTALGVTLTGLDSHIPALPLTYTVTSNPAHGTLSGTAPNLTYTPAVSFLGSDSFAFKVNNGTLDSASVSVNLSVTGPTFANSSFEAPSVGFASFQYNPSGGAWSFTGSSGVQSNGSAWGAANAADGTQTAFLQGHTGPGALGSISQNVNFTGTGNFAVTFQAARRLGQVQPIKISVDGVPVSGLLTPASNNFGPLTSAIFPISAPGNHTITLSATDSSADLTTLVDQVSIVLSP